MKLRFDPNRRNGDETYIAFNEQPEMRGAVVVGDIVAIVAEEARLEGKAQVIEVDEDFVTLRVGWSDLHR